MSQNPKFEDVDFDLGELFSTLWAHKLLITWITGLCICVAAYYSVNTKKTFTAQAVFDIQEKGGSAGFSLTKNLGALASLTGLASGKNSSNLDTLLERTSGREFILKFNEKYSLDLDPHFNTYDPDYKDPFWKATIKQLIGWEKTQSEKNAIVEHNVVSNYRKHVAFNKSKKSNTVTVSVTHVKPKKASEYTNAIMDEIRLLVEYESAAAQNRQLNYLSETLADALQEMEVAQANLKNYTLNNSSLAQENFITDTLKLDDFRVDKRKVKEISDLLYVIEELLRSGKTDNNAYETLRLNHPLVDDIDFRRILGMSETISAWVWPKIETIEAVNATLQDRAKRLNVEIQKLEENARIYAASAEGLAKLTRDAKIAEATYTVLIEQIKSQSLAAGFQPETFKVFEYATSPLSYSTPKIRVMLGFGAAIGLLIGCCLSFIIAIRRGVHYTQTSLISNVNAELSLKSKSIKRLARKSISDIISLISNRQITVLNEATVKLGNKKIIYVVNTGGRLSASDATRLLATQSAQFGKNVVLCDTTGKSENEIKNNSSPSEVEFSVSRASDKINIMTNTKGSYFFTSLKFNSTMKDLTKRFDQVFVCTSNDDAQLGLMALTDFIPGLVVVAGLRKTKKLDIQNLKLKKSIDLLFYE